MLRTVVGVPLIIILILAFLYYRRHYKSGNSELSEKTGQQPPPEPSSERAIRPVQRTKICPDCGQGTLYWNPNTSDYECLNSLCNGKFAQRDLRRGGSTPIRIPFLLLTILCLGVICYAAFKFNELGQAATIGIISVASIGAIWSLATITGLLRLSPVRPGYLMVLFPFLMILVVSGTMLWISESSHSKLEAKEIELVSVKGQLSTTEADLSNTKARINDLNSQTTSLKNQMTSLNIQLNDARIRIGSTQSTIAGLQNTVNQLQAELKLYQDTGITVYSGIQQPVSDRAGVPVTLTWNPAAHNPTWDELRSFILADRTDSNPYVNPTYTCADFARDVHNNAEAAGIRAAFVTVTFQGQSSGHALDAFVTTDKGLIYIDCTGTPPGQLGPSNCDKTVMVKPGTQFTAQLIVPQSGLFGWLFGWLFGGYYDSIGIVATVQIYW